VDKYSYAVLYRKPSDDAMERSFWVNRVKSFTPFQKGEKVIFPAHLREFQDKKYPAPDWVTSQETWEVVEVFHQVNGSDREFDYVVVTPTDEDMPKVVVGTTQRSLLGDPARLLFDPGDTAQT